MAKLQCFGLLRMLGFAWLLFLVSQASLWAQSYGGGLMYSSYLPFGSIYNSLRTQNTVTNYEATTSNFVFGKNDIAHYAPGIAITGAYALSGFLTSIDLGIMAGPGRKSNIIPDFPVRPFIALNAGYKFTPSQFPVGVYLLGGAYLDFALGEGKNSYQFLHLLMFLRLAPGVSLKLNVLEIFAQVQIGVGIQMEKITLESKAGNEIYDGTFVMLPVALFPEIGVRFWS